MIQAKQVASYFIEKASSLGAGNEELSGNNDLTNLKLQKLLYFAQVEHIKETGEKLFPEKIEAWKYGPVVRDVYSWLAGCGPYVITEFDVQLEDTSQIDDETKRFLDKIWDKYKNSSAWALVQLTHRSGSAWDQTFKNGAGEKMEISPELMVATA